MALFCGLVVLSFILVALILIDGDAVNVTFRACNFGVVMGLVLCVRGYLHGLLELDGFRFELVGLFCVRLMVGNLHGRERCGLVGFGVL